jgi:hypothetical protein
MIMSTIDKLREVYESLFPIDGINEEEINEIRTALNVCLPEDFCEIASFYSGGLLGGISIHSFANSGSSTSIINETLRLRNSIHLPLRFVVLAEPAESLIVMDTQNTPSIIWCDAVEASKLDNRSFASKPDEWNTFTEFFAQMLEDEEEEQMN